jgi:hypothetical protein
MRTEIGEQKTGEQKTEIGEQKTGEQKIGEQKTIVAAQVCQLPINDECA